MTEAEAVAVPRPVPVLVLALLGACNMDAGCLAQALWLTGLGLAESMGMCASEQLPWQTHLSLFIFLALFVDTCSPGWQLRLLSTLIWLPGLQQINRKVQAAVCRQTQSSGGRKSSGQILQTP